MWCTLDKTYDESWCKTINCHDSPSYYTTWTLNLERMLNLCQNQQKVLIYEWDPKVAIYPYGLGYCWWRLVTTGILNRGSMISHWIETICLIGWSKWHVIMKSLATVIHLVEFDICSLELEYVNWSHNKWDPQLKDLKSILICDSTTLLDYRYQFMGSLHVVNNKSQT